MHPNEQVLRDIDEAQVRDDVEAFMNAFTDDIVVHVPGRNALAGEHRGKEAFGSLFERFMQLAGEYSFEPHAYLADDEHGVSLQRSSYRRDGRSIEARETYVVHFRDGKVAELWFLTEDQAAFDEYLGG